MSLAIRRAEASDGPALVALRRQLFRETANMLWEPDEFQATAEDESRRIARLNARPNSQVLLAEDGGVPVGLLTAVGGEVRRLRHSATLALGVARSHWGRGAARAMLDETRQWAQAAGLHRLELTVHTTNQRALGVYLRAGFEVEGLRRHSLLVDGRFVDEYLMALLLRSPGE